MGMRETETIAGLVESMSMLYEDPRNRPRRPEPFKLREKQHKSNSWVQLSKVERRGKTYEEMRTLRLQKWERQNNKRLRSKQSLTCEILAVKLK